jgi:cell division protein FtsI/penicillin-binding protein 2
MQAGVERRRAGRGRLSVESRWWVLLGLLLMVGFTPDFARGQGADISSPVSTEPAGNVPAEILEAPPITRDVLQHSRIVRAAAPGGPGSRLIAEVPVPASAPELEGPLQVEYTLDPGLTKQVFDILARLDARLANVVVLEATTGRVLAYASSDPVRFPPTRIYPAASLIKVVTAAAALHHANAIAEGPCRFLGNPHWLSPRQLDPPKKGHVTDLSGALAHSNNQCFAQLAVHAVGSKNMVDAIRRFGFLQEPAPGHSAGAVDAGSDRFDLGRLGCGLYGCWITPMHAARMAMTLADGKQREPYWIERVTDANGHLLQMPPRRPAKQVLTPALAGELRTMMIETTVSGTAKRGFQGDGGAPMLGPVQVSGKTGTLSGSDPAGLYEWFAGVAPADDPKIAIAVVSVAQNGHRVRATRIASEVLEGVFCGRGGCRPDAVEHMIHVDEASASDHDGSLVEPAAGG